MSNASYQQTLVIGLAMILAASLVQPLFPEEQILQHAPMPLVLPLLLIAARRQWLSNTAMTCLVAFLLLHVLGARYIYSNVPFGDSLEFLALGGETADRNHYDRLVHLAFGLLMMCPIVNVAQTYGGLTRLWALAFALCVVFGFSAVYEIFEWLLTVVMAPDQADAYNGQQGDIWDAQKDMLLAGLGAISALPFVGSTRESKQLPGMSPGTP